MYWINPIRLEEGTLEILNIKLMSSTYFCLLPKVWRPVLICDSFNSHKYESISSILLELFKNIISLKSVLIISNKVFSITLIRLEFNNLAS